MDEILHHFETKGNQCLLVFTGPSSFEGFLGGAGFCPSTVGCFGEGRTESLLSEVGMGINHEGG